MTYDIINKYLNPDTRASLRISWIIQSFSTCGVACKTISSSARRTYRNRAFARQYSARSSPKIVSTFTTKPRRLASKTRVHASPSAKNLRLRRIKDSRSRRPFSPFAGRGPDIHCQYWKFIVYVTWSIHTQSILYAVHIGARPKLPDRSRMIRARRDRDTRSHPRKV